ncbi:3-dehydroquinate synthase [Longimicrobium sp.]|uniref:3-dehydroquinate synthase n=1 Tax=Longimicrobium sp. TaxID=2029185 RepID=UPI003B3B8B80
MSTPHRVKVSLPEGNSRSYEVLVGLGLFSNIASILSRFCPAHRYAVVTDDHVAELYAVRLSRMLHGAGYRTDVFAFTSGEEQKNRETWALVSDAMLEAGCGRDTALVAFGGGVPGDLGGFVAATYMRGLPFVQVPTSLLAMIDASVGGKTGVDTPAGKNLVGAFHQPHCVVIDPELLQTLPEAHLRAGLAEAVKHGAIADAEYLQWIEQNAESLLAGDPQALARLIVRSVEIKAEIVARDEKESGPRKLLNFGHTIAHAVEAVSGYAMLHGEAVAVGMVEEARIGEKSGVTVTGTAARLRKLLTRLGLPTSLPLGYAADEVVGWTRTDKKARNGRVEYALIQDIGTPLMGKEGRWGHAVADETVVEVLAGAGRS